MNSQRNPVVRRAFLFGVPFLYVVLGLLHPTANPEVGDETALFINLHIAQLFLIGGLAYVLWLLVDLAMMLILGRGKSLHDYFAGTRVVWDTK